MALVLISHDLGVVSETCDRVAVMYAGRIVEQAPAVAIFTAPLHPYTQGLIGALPPIAGPRRRLQTIAGTVPDPKAMPAGCAFAPRCALAETRCRNASPPLLSRGQSRQVACVRAPGDDSRKSLPEREAA
jgi:peptide/nickel transport system ATP-binding protein